jgi:hypothetical protein
MIDEKPKKFFNFAVKKSQFDPMFRDDDLRKGGA